MKQITTFATAQQVPLRKETKYAGGGVAIDNEGQFAIGLVPDWSEWGRTLVDGTQLQEGKRYKITIEVEE